MKLRTPKSWQVTLRVERLEVRSTPSTMTPAQIRHAYGFDQIGFISGNQAIPGDGRGLTIAIVNAYHNPTLVADADAFDRTFSINGGGLSLFDQYGPASQWLTVATPQGVPSYDAGWAQEIALDVQWAHAISPGAHILLVEAKSSSLTDLLSAVDYARRYPTVAVVSMSWGASEFSAETQYDQYFTTPAGHTPVAFVAASGDDGAPPIWPSTSANVVAVGGSTLRIDSSGNYASETAWSGSGGGVSRYVRQPSFQSAFVSSAARTTPDVAYDADPNSGFYVRFNSQWYAIGGTSAGSPQWAALMGIVDQARMLYGQPIMNSASALTGIYSLTSNEFHDVTTGNNGYSARAGYDLATGRGSPFAQRIVGSLVSAPFVSTVTSTGSANGLTNNGTGLTSGGTRWFIWTMSPALSTGAPADSMFVVIVGSMTPVSTTIAAEPPPPVRAVSFTAAATQEASASHAPGVLTFGNGVARLDWSESTEETEIDWSEVEQCTGGLPQD